MNEAQHDTPEAEPYRLWLSASDWLDLVKLINKARAREKAGNPLWYK